MDTFWLKIAIVLGAVLVGAILLVNFMASKFEAEPEPRSFYDVAREDRQRLLAEPQPQEEVKPEPQPAEQQPSEEQRTEQSTQTMQEAPEPAKSINLYFAELSEIDKIEAEKLLNVAAPARSIGRLPVTGFKLMVDTCRQIIQKWPDSWYAYRAKQMLGEMPTRFRPRYNITPEELDLSRFEEPRPGTKLFVIKEPD